VLLRFAVVYVLLYAIPFVLAFPADVAAWPPVNWQPLRPVTAPVVSWVGEHVFQVEAPTRQWGCGDSTADFVLLFCHVVLAAAAAAVWSLLDRKRPGYPRLLAWFRVAVCFYLAAQMLIYGMCKVIPNQFGSPSPLTLASRVGDLDRFSLLWMFMGASPAYTVFAGAAELLAGLLLVCRRTRLLGALLCAGVMANVVMLNICYDVCVKLHSGHLLALCLFVAAADGRRLVDFFVRGRAPQPDPHRPLFANRRLRLAARVLTAVLVVAFVGLSLNQNLVRSQSVGHLAPKPPLHGLWYVTEVVADGEVQPQLVGSPRYWQRAAIDPGLPGLTTPTLHVITLDWKHHYYGLALDTERHTLALSKYGDPSWKAPLSYREPAADTLVLEGVLDGRQVRITLRRFDESRWRINQDTRWISDRP
jgi:hypothetical protein